MSRISRRRLFAALAPAVGAGVAAKAGLLPTGGTALARDAHSEPGRHGTATKPPSGPHAHAGEGHLGFPPGARVDHRANGFDPGLLIRDFDHGRTRRLASGRVLREWELVAQDKEIEVAPGVKFAAWTYNGRIPGPSLRCREGERLRIKFGNGSDHPHTIHFHGIHPAEMDGVPGVGLGVVPPGRTVAYEFDADPFGLHLYHCHVTPLADHIAKGMYGAFVIDPRKGRPGADELLMVMNGFDTDFDRSNELYAVNSIPFAYMNDPVRVKRGELVRIYLVNALEFDLVNSLHVHANFFHYFPTGTSLEPVEYTDTVMQCQGQRGILELRFPHEGKFMFHAHQSEFAQLGWMGFFEVVA
jgi:FtsP/CotA-like multicopper oxidase with cupredoxin domain